MDSGLLERLTKLKKERKLTLKDMADAAGVTVSAASHWLKGISNIRDHHLQRIADNYKLDYFELKYGRPARGPSLKSSPKLATKSALGPSSSSTTPDVEAIRALKEEYQATLRDLIVDLQNRTGCRVIGIRLEKGRPSIDLAV